MNQESSTASYVGQVERDVEGRLWAVLYLGDRVVRKEQVRSLRKGRRRVTDLVLSAADALAPSPHRSAPAQLSRVVAPQTPAPRNRCAPVAGVH